MISIPFQTIDVALIIGVITLFTLLARIVIQITRFLDHLSAMLVVWEGTDSKPGVLERLDEIENKVNDIQYHVKPNHGNSSFDDQNRRLKEIMNYLKDN